MTDFIVFYKIFEWEMLFYTLEALDYVKVRKLS